MRNLENVNGAGASSAVVMIRLLVGWVFVVEGVLKFIRPDELGAGRFARIGIPAPHAAAAFVGGAEIVCGALLLAGLLTRLAAIPLLVNMIVAIVSTKVPILIGHNLGIFALPKLPVYGLWTALHESRTDVSMILGLLFLLITGPGRWSLDAMVWPGRTAQPAEQSPSREAISLFPRSAAQ